MALSDFVAAVVAVLRRRPGDLLPVYLLGVAVPAIVRVVPFLAIGIAYLVLSRTGRLESIRTHLVELDPPPSPSDDQEAFDAWASGLEPVVDQLVTPSLVALAVVTIIVSVLLFVVLSAVVAAGQLAACYGRLRDERGLVAGIDGVRRYWLRFLGLFVLEGLCWMAVLGAIAIGTALVAGIVSLVTGSMALALPAALIGVLVAFVVLLVVRALFAFAPVAIVVDDAGVFGSLRSAAGFVRARPVEAGFYYVIAIGIVVGISTLTGLFSIVNVVSIGSLVSALIAMPALDLLKTAVYCGYRDRLAPPAPPTRSLRDGARAGLRRGWRELVSFVRARPGTHAFVVGLGLLGFWLGWIAADPLVGTFEASIAARLEGWLPPAMAIELFGNNWLVALMTAFAGVALVIPAIASLLFNGIFLGITARLEAEPMELVAFVVPHGVLEIPAILIAGALGVSVGVSAWRTWRGRATRTDLADALERAFWVLVGIGILLAIAAVIEGFVSPYYYRFFL
ncbi:stage II sporulation protein M [Natrinema zhouii]|uniref:Stage II sporulation protein M n=1 Tax=Natrinema zhouii TaxID=1710539 RepID=A0A7D6CSN2_9EURY|nr:stage II sporulation protein M [Natrinema zhouii]QLK26953.1 stage II sporulation protein M [Natrinema zhouii]